jgi:hypothetical protein
MSKAMTMSPFNIKITGMMGKGFVLPTQTPTTPLPTAPTTTLSPTTPLPTVLPTTSRPTFVNQTISPGDQLNTTLAPTFSPTLPPTSLPSTSPPSSGKGSKKMNTVKIDLGGKMGLPSNLAQFYNPATGRIEIPINYTNLLMNGKGG